MTTPVLEITFAASALSNLMGMARRVANQGHPAAPNRNREQGQLQKGIVPVIGAWSLQ
jgi:hypothetical protein